jgi:acetyl-CoA C-acetyltransferase
MKPRTVIVSAARTPIGRFEGALAHTSATDLGGIAIGEATRRARLSPDAVDAVFMGNVLAAGLGQAPARQAARKAGLSSGVPCTTVNKVCGSGLYAAMLARLLIDAGEADVVVAGGMESMTNAPYLLDKARQGYRMGHGELADAMLRDGLTDPFDRVHMGQYGDAFAKEHGFSREAQDVYARETYERARAAQAAGVFDGEIVPVAAATRGKASSVPPALITADEEPSRFAPEKMPSLPPAFGAGGTVTAANASKINDGGAALVLMSDDAARARELPVRARVVADATWAGDAPQFPGAPARAIALAAKKAGVAIADIGVFEISEAFAVVPLAAMRELGIPRDRVNLYGGGISLGHPIGCSGARLLVTLVGALERTGQRYGCATLCLGGGEAVAMIVERG